MVSCRATCQYCVTSKTVVHVNCKVDHSDTDRRKESIIAGTQKMGEQSPGTVSGGGAVINTADVRYRKTDIRFANLHS